MRRNAAVALVAFAALLVVSAGVWATADPADPHRGQPTITLVAAHDWVADDPAYEGSRTGCRRCHLKQYRSWEKTTHATAFETLPEENRSDPDCVTCHVTGFGEATGFTSIAGVGCEVCHGPGSLYTDKETMASREASVAAGLIVPDEKTCLACHNDESPNFSGFNYEEFLATGVHDIEQ